jgi:hypothetical protein
VCYSCIRTAPTLLRQFQIVSLENGLLKILVIRTSPPSNPRKGQIAPGRQPPKRTHESCSPASAACFGYAGRTVEEARDANGQGVAGLGVLREETRLEMRKLMLVLPI